MASHRIPPLYRTLMKPAGLERVNCGRSRRRIRAVNRAPRGAIRDHARAHESAATATSMSEVLPKWPARLMEAGMFAFSTGTGAASSACVAAVQSLGPEHRWRNGNQPRIDGSNCGYRRQA